MNSEKNNTLNAKQEKTKFNFAQKKENTICSLLEVEYLFLEFFLLVIHILRIHCL